MSKRRADGSKAGDERIEKEDQQLTDPAAKKARGDVSRAANDHKDHKSQVARHKAAAAAAGAADGQDQAAAAAPSSAARRAPSKAVAAAAAGDPMTDDLHPPSQPDTSSDFAIACALEFDAAGDIDFSKKVAASYKHVDPGNPPDPTVVARELGARGMTIRSDDWILKIGSCQFESLADQLLLRDNVRLELKDWVKRRAGEALKVRTEAVAWLRANPKFLRNKNDPDSAIQNYVVGGFEKYCNDMLNPVAWGDHVTLMAVCEVKRCSIIVYHDRPAGRMANGTATHITQHHPRDDDGKAPRRVLRVWHWSENHYSSVIPVDLPGRLAAASQSTSNAAAAAAKIGVGPDRFAPMEIFRAAYKLDSELAKPKEAKSISMSQSKEAKERRFAAAGKDQKEDLLSQAKTTREALQKIAKVLYADESPKKESQASSLLHEHATSAKQELEDPLEVVVSMFGVQGTGKSYVTNHLLLGSDALSKHFDGSVPLPSGSKDTVSRAPVRVSFAKGRLRIVSYVYAPGAAQAVPAAAAAAAAAAPMVDAGLGDLKRPGDTGVAVTVFKDETVAYDAAFTESMKFAALTNTRDKLCALFADPNFSRNAAYVELTGPFRGLQLKHGPELPPIKVEIVDLPGVGDVDFMPSAMKAEIKRSSVVMFRPAAHSGRTVSWKDLVDVIEMGALSSYAERAMMVPVWNNYSGYVPDTAALDTFDALWNEQKAGLRRAWQVIAPEPIEYAPDGVSRGGSGAAAAPAAAAAAVAVAASGTEADIVEAQSRVFAVMSDMPTMVERQQLLDKAKAESKPLLFFTAKTGAELGFRNPVQPCDQLHGIILDAAHRKLQVRRVYPMFQACHLSAKQFKHRLGVLVRDQKQKSKRTVSDFTWGWQEGTHNTVQFSRPTDAELEKVAAEWFPKLKREQKGSHDPNSAATEPHLKGFLQQYIRSPEAHKKIRACLRQLLLKRMTDLISLFVLKAKETIPDLNVPPSADDNDDAEENLNAALNRAAREKAKQIEKSHMAKTAEINALIVESVTKVNSRFDRIKTTLHNIDKNGDHDSFLSKETNAILFGEFNTDASSNEDDDKPNTMRAEVLLLLRAIVYDLLGIGAAPSTGTRAALFASGDNDRTKNSFEKAYQKASKVLQNEFTVTLSEQLSDNPPQWTKAKAEEVRDKLYPLINSTRNALRKCNPHFALGDAPTLRSDSGPFPEPLRRRDPEPWKYPKHEAVQPKIDSAFARRLNNVMNLRYQKGKAKKEADAGVVRAFKQSNPWYNTKTKKYTNDEGEVVGARQAADAWGLAWATAINEVLQPPKTDKPPLPAPEPKLLQCARAQLLPLRRSTVTISVVVRAVVVPPAPASLAFASASPAAAAGAGASASVSKPTVGGGSRGAGLISVMRDTAARRLTAFMDPVTAARIDEYKKQLKLQDAPEKTPAGVLWPIYIPSHRHGVGRRGKGNLLLDSDGQSEAGLENLPALIFVGVEPQHLEHFKRNFQRDLEAHPNVTLIWVVLPVNHGLYGYSFTVGKLLMDALGFARFWTSDDDIHFVQEYDRHAYRWTRSSLRRMYLFGQMVMNDALNGTVKTLSLKEIGGICKDLKVDSSEVIECAATHGLAVFSSNPGLLRNHSGVQLWPPGELESVIAKLKEKAFEGQYAKIAGVSIMHGVGKKSDYVSKTTHDDKKSVSKGAQPGANFRWSTQRYVVVLHNAEAIRGFNMITDDVLFMNLPWYQLTTEELSPELQILRDAWRKEPQGSGDKSSDKRWIARMFFHCKIGYQVYNFGHEKMKFKEEIGTRAAKPSYERTDSETDRE